MKDSGTNQITFGGGQRPDTVEEIGGKPSFAGPGQRPKDFNRFQTAVRNQIKELQ